MLQEAVNKSDFTKHINLKTVINTITQFIRISGQNHKLTFHDNTFIK